MYQLLTRDLIICKTITNIERFYSKTELQFQTLFKKIRKKTIKGTYK